MKLPQKLLSIAIALLIILVSLIGLLNTSVYAAKVNKIPQNELYGQDSITLILAFTLLIISISLHHTFIRKIFYEGILLYMIYTYSYYCFSLITTPLYIFYILIFSSSLYLFIFSVNGTFLSLNDITIKQQYPRKSLSIFLVIIALIMIIMEVTEIAQKTIFSSTNLSTYDVFYVLDLAILFPGIIIISWLNYRRITIGISLAGIILIKVVTLLPALFISDCINYFTVGKFIDPTFSFMSLIIILISIVFITLYVRSFKKR